ncbi:response regulator transcription factor [Tenacibaculum maritimum]|uniref:response regulator transcription factor n=1 Tax=Tenacibaculum maritimum TaxID=107401 RepID=UPI00387700C2
MSKKIKLLIVDDHQLVIEGILSSLKKIDHLEVETSKSCDDAFFKIKTNQHNAPFDILFTDLSFDNTTYNTILNDGESLIKKINEEKIPIKIGIITGHSETNRIYNVIHNLNPSAYILKSKCDSAELNFAIQKIIANETYYSHEIHNKLLKRAIVLIQMDDIATQILKELRKHPKISNLEGLILKSDGSPIKLRAIESKLAKLRIDLDANNNTDLVLKAIELGLID